MRFEVPQFIEIEDKIFGPLTWKQFVYILGGAGALFMLYVTLPFVIFLLIGTPLAALTFGLAFYKVNNRPFSIVLESFVTYLAGGRLYLWKKKDKQIHHTEAATPTTYMPPSASSLHTLSRQLELNALQKKR